MKLDHHLLTGMFLGITVGLWFMEGLIAYLPFFILGSIVYLMRFVHSR